MGMGPGGQPFGPLGPFAQPTGPPLANGPFNGFGMGRGAAPMPMAPYAVLPCPRHSREPLDLTRAEAAQQTNEQTLFHIRADGLPLRTLRSALTVRSLTATIHHSPNWQSSVRLRLPTLRRQAALKIDHSQC